MIKFYKVKGTEIRKAAEVDETGNVIKVIAIIGQVKELLEKEIIFEGSMSGNTDKWLVVYRDSTVITRDFNSLSDAKASVKV